MTIHDGRPSTREPPPEAREDPTRAPSADLDAKVLRAIGRSSCKLMFRDDEGNHREVPMPACDGVVRVQATHCHMHLERACPDLREELLPERVRRLRIDRVNAYISAPGSSTALHFDVRTVVIVQLVGRKVWELSDHAAVEHPTANCVAPPDAGFVAYDGGVIRVPTEMRQYELAPGDWLIVPKATWHRTTTRTGSVSVTLALPPT